MHREIHLDTEKIQKTYSAPPRKKKKSIFFYGKVNVFQLFDFWPFLGSLSINWVICFRKEPESTDIRTHLDGKLKGYNSTVCM